MELARTFSGKKFMWDGKAYAAEKEMEATALEYADDAFEVETVSEGSEHFLFTRRAVTETAVDSGLV